MGNDENNNIEVMHQQNLGMEQVMATKTTSKFGLGDAHNIKVHLRYSS
jgi:hypothetical protein